LDDSLRQTARTARAEIERGSLVGAALLERLLSIPRRDRDAWTDELLGLDVPPPDAPDLPRGSVPYLPCGVDEIMALVGDAPVGQEDELVDLGSGLGKVVILAHLLSGARCRGIEIQEHLVSSARARCAGLSLAGVSFTHANVVDVELDGSIFFLYAPFNGQMLRAALRRLEDVARTRPIVLCTVDLELHDVPWLVRREPSNVSLAIYDSLQRWVQPPVFVCQ
jgi:hypothetical protein